MSLTDWSASGWVNEHTPSRQEIRDLLAVADRDLRQCLTSGLDADWRLAIAYNAALQCATAALAAAGYRAEREAHHYRVIGSLALTIVWPPAKVRLFQRFRRKRHEAGYERAGAVSPQDAEEMLALAQELRVDVQDWLIANHRELLEAAP